MRGMWWSETTRECIYNLPPSPPQQQVYIYTIMDPETPRYFTEYETGWLVGATQAFVDTERTIPWKTIAIRMKEASNGTTIFPRSEQAVCIQSLHYLHTNLHDLHEHT
jgi:hypothetical protein